MSAGIIVRANSLWVINCGSSSIKYQLIDLASQRWLLKGLLENIGAEARHHLTIRLQNNDTPEHHRSDVVCENATAALQVIAQTIKPFQTMISGIVHRVVHGGSRFTQPTRLNADTIEALQSLNSLAPLHNPANLQGIRLCCELFPELPQFAVFDTAFHATLAPQAFRYAIPEDWYAMGIRRYGFHGNSHQYVAEQAALFLQKTVESTSIISLHLGNGASVTATQNGQSIDTSMGFTPLEGLMMGTRSGDLDVGILGFVAQQKALTLAQIEHQLLHESGLRGIAGSNDMRQLLEEAANGIAQATLAIDMYCYRGKKYIGAYLAALSQVDAIVFTGGIGENASVIREKMLSGLAAFGISLDTTLNNGVTEGITCISDHRSLVPVLVIPTNEELQMAKQVAALLST